MSKSGEQGLPLDGVRVVEVATFGYVPAAGAAMADWGADVIKVEALSGDPIRRVENYGIPPGHRGVTYLWEVLNRGKRAVAIDISQPAGLDVLLKLVDTADVFTTNFLPPARTKLGIDVAHICARNPAVVYGRGSAHGPAGPDAARGGFDGLTYWHRTGVGSALMGGGVEHPVNLAGPAFGDVQSGLGLAAGILAALFRRERSGSGGVVDGSLLSSGLWAMQASVAATSVLDVDRVPRDDRDAPPNPIYNIYRLADGRFVALAMLEAQRYWPGLCAAVGRDDLVLDARFQTADVRRTNTRACVAELDRTFAAMTADEAQRRLGTQSGQWSLIAVVGQARHDLDAIANGYVQSVDCGGDQPLPLVSAPAQFDGRPPQLRRAPALGEHTDEVLDALGFHADLVAELRRTHVVA